LICVKSRIISNEWEQYLRFIIDSAPAALKNEKEETHRRLQARSPKIKSDLHQQHLRQQPPPLLNKNKKTFIHKGDESVLLVKAMNNREVTDAIAMATSRRLRNAMDARAQGS